MTDDCLDRRAVRAHVPRHRMNRRITALWLFVLYGAAGLLLTLSPHQHADYDGDSDGDCAACVWQVSSATDVPVVAVAVVEHSVVPLWTPSVVSVTVEFAFFALAAGRAPPETTA